MARINFSIGFNVDKNSVNQIKQELTGIQKIISQSGSSDSALSKEMKEALRYTNLLEQALNKATNNNLGKLNVKTFNEELKKSNTSLAQVYAKLKDAGVDGSHAIKKLNREIQDTGVKVRETSKLLDDMFDTFGKTVKWGIASSLMNQMSNSISKAVQFTKDLDNSLNNIRIVSGQNKSEMEAFAKEANEAAKALGKTTTEYTDASLLFFQQGKNAEEVRELSNATLMASNITGTGVSDMADMITSALNGYSLAADKAIYVTDVLAAVGAATGSDFEELAVGMSKVASQAATVGVPFEKLNAMLATISETTREAPETIGTSLKTIFARMSEVQTKGSAEDEDGTYLTLGKVQDALSQVNISLLDETGAMRDMGDVIEEIGGKWETFDTITKSAITNALAGQRQSSRLISLFNQWDRYEIALNEAMNATGTTVEQNEIRMDSMHAKLKSLTAELENIWMNIIDSDALKSGIDMITSLLSKVNDLMDSFGGVRTLIMGLAGVIGTVFGKQITNSIGNTVSNIKGSIERVKEYIGTGEPDEKRKERTTELKVREGLSKEDFSKYKEEKGKLQDLDLEIAANKKLAEMQKEKIRLAKEYEAVGKQVISEGEASAENKFRIKQIQAQKEAVAWQQAMIRDGYTYENLIEEITEDEARKMGQTKETLKLMGSFEEVITDIQSQTMYDGFISGLDDDIEELKNLDAELENIQKEIKDTEAARNKNVERTQELESRRVVQASNVDELETEGLNSQKWQMVTKGVGAFMTAAAVAGPVIKTLGDETATASDKLDIMGDSLIGMSASLAMMGGPIGLIGGGLSLLAGIALKVAKNFQAYDKAVKQNEETVERYNRRVSELKEEISSLENQQSRLTSLQTEIALVGGDLTKLTVEQQQAYKDLGNEIAQTTPQMVAYYDEEGNAILKTTASLQSYIDTKKESLQVEKEIMVANKESFLIEYSRDMQQNEERLKIEQDKVSQLKEELDNLKASGAKAKKITKKEEELQASMTEVENLKSSLENIDANIQTNIIDPFMQSKEEIIGVDDAVKQVVAGTYDLEGVQGVLDKYQYKWEIINGEPKKVKRNYQEMAQMVGQDLEYMEEKALNVATAVRRIQSKSGEKGDVGQEYSDLFNKLKSLDQVTQDYVGTASTFGLTLEGTEKILKKLITTVDEFGIAAPVDLQDVLPIATESARKEIEETQESLKDLYKQYADAKDKVNTNKADYDSSLVKAGYDLTNAEINSESRKAYADASREVDRLEGEINNKLTRQEYLKQQVSEMEQNSIVKQQELNKEYEKYLTSVASTPEGLNKVIESYNAQFETLRSFNEQLNQRTTETRTVTDESGQETQVEVERVSDTELGVQMHEFENTLDDIREGAMARFGDSFMEATEKAFQASKEITDTYAEMGESLRSMPEGVLDSFAEMNSGIKDSVDKIKSGTEDAADIDSVVKAVNKQQQALGRMYAVINKDSTTYFTDFKAQNVEQMKLIGMATGVMADDYATYAQYTADLDKWMADNAVWLSNEKVSSNYWSMVESINAMAEEGRMYDVISGEMVTTSDMDSEARSQAAKAAAYAAVAAEAEAGLEKAKIMQQSLASISYGGVDKKIADAVQPILEQRAAEVEADIMQYQAVMSQFESMAQRAAERSGTGGAAASRNTTTTAPMNNLNYSAGAGNVATRPTAPPPSTAPSTPASLGGGGGDSGSSSKEKEVEDLEWEKDIYHDINIELQQKETLLDKLKKQQEKLYGKELLDNLAKQKKLLQEQQKTYERKLAMQKEDLANQRSILAAQGTMFNADGTIANYNQLLERKVAYVNSLSGEAKEAAKEEFEKLTDMLSKYEELMMNSIVETENAIQDSIDAQREIFLQEYEYAIQLKIEISGDLKESLDFLKEMNDEYEDFSDNFGRAKEQISEQVDLVERLKIKLDDINTNSVLTEKERLELLEKYSDELKTSLKDLKELNEELTKIFEDTLKGGLDLVKEQITSFSDLNNQLKHYEQTLKLIGEGENYKVLNDIYESQYTNLMGQVSVLNSQMEILKNSKRDLEAAGMVGTEEWKAVEDAIVSTQKEINSLAQESLKLLQTEFKNTVDEILSTLDDALSGGSGLKEVKKQLQEIKDDRKMYLDGEEKLLAVSKLQEKVQKDIEETTDPARKKQLQKFADTELKNLKEKNKLTQYDVDRANQVYDLTLKQMALEEQRATKNVMRLVRDTQGNWVYEFTEDANAIAKAQEDVSSSMEKLLELDKKRLEETQDLMLKLQEEYYAEVQQITVDAANGKFATEDELRKKLEEVNAKYNQKMTEANNLYETARQNATISSMGVMIEVYKNTGLTLDGMTKEQQELLKNMTKEVGNSYLEIRDAVKNLLSGDEDSIRATMETLGYSTEENMGRVQDAMISLAEEMKYQWGIDIAEMISKINGEDGFGVASTTALNSIISAWEEYRKKMTSVQAATKTEISTIKNDINNLTKETNTLTSATEKVITKFNDEISALTKLTSSYKTNRDEIQKNIDSMTKYAKSIDDVIAAIKRKNDTEATKTQASTSSKPSTSSSSSSSSSSSGASSKPAAPKIAEGSVVQVKPGTRWYYDSFGKDPSGQAYSGNLQITYLSPYSSSTHPINLGTKPGEYLGWVRKSDIQGYDTGGYTGEWGKEGKMAFLHEKEIVLNKEDTAKILDAVKLVRGISGNALNSIADAIALTSKKTIEALNSVVSTIIPKDSVGVLSSSQSPIQQNVEINADFSGVRSADEIEKAFENMANMASQYVARR